MPTYDYHCESCGDFEVMQNIKEDPLGKCPQCGGTVKRLISKNVGIIFKGSGFYINDSRPTSQPDKKDTPVSTSKKDEKAS